MNALLNWLSGPEGHHVTRALLHTLWQGGIAALALAAVLRAATRPEVRYRAALVALIGIVGTGVLTWAVQSQRPQNIQRRDGAGTTAVVSDTRADDPQNVGRGAVQPRLTFTDAASGLPPESASTSRARWTVWFGVSWIVGAALMLIRAAWQFSGAERLRRASQPVEEPRFQAMLEDAAALVRVARCVRLRVIERVTSPAVVGVMVPVLVMPSALLTSLSPEQLRFIFLHELAHIRRGDYFTNLFQLLVESVLFFNPAVWWISQQLRREREACCDAVAIALSGAPADYARTLVHVAETMSGVGSAAIAFGAERHGSPLGERVRRLVVPGYRPALRLSWRTMTVALTAGLLLLLLSASATRMAVAAILTPQQRIDKIERKMEALGERPTVASRSMDDAQRIPVTVQVRLADGSPLPRHSSVLFHVESGHSSGTYAMDVHSNRASYKVPPGWMWVETRVEGYAPTISPRVDGTRTNAVDLGELVVDRGFELPLSVIDSVTGKPVSKAPVRASFVLSATGSTLQDDRNVVTDENGRVLVPRCLREQLRLFVNAPGYELTEQRYDRVAPGQKLELKLRPGKPFDGQIVDAATGAGISGAVIRVLGETGPTSVHHGWRDDAYVLTTTDERGHFSVTQLRSGSRYWLGVSAAGHESVILPELTTTQSGMIVKLGPELVVRGRVEGDLTGLQRINGQPALFRNWSEKVMESTHGDSEWTPVFVSNGVATFCFTNRIAGRVELYGPKHIDGRDITAPVNDWVIDLNARERRPAYGAEDAPKREVIFRFKHASGVPPRGTVSVTIPSNLDPEHLAAISEEREITNGEVRVQIAIGGRTGIEPRKMIGYWFNPSGGNFEALRPVVPAGDGPFVVEVPVVAAGAIYATALNADGTRAGGLFFGIDVVKSGAVPDGMRLDSSDSLSGTAPRTWVSGPVPLGGVYRIYGWRGNSFCQSEPIRLTEAKPDSEVQLQFGPVQTLSGVVLNSRGEPLSDVEVDPQFSFGNDHSFGLTKVFTDDAGHFGLENTTPELGSYTAVIRAAGYVAQRIKLKPGRAQTVRLAPGHVLAGQIIEAGTSKVVADTELRAVNVEDTSNPMVTVKSDKDGRFRFDTMADVTYTLFCGAGNVVGGGKVRPTGETNVTIVVKPYVRAARRGE